MASIKEYNPWLDAVRVLACFFVCMVHAPLPANGVGSIWLSMYNYLSVPCIGLFFMVSGALLFPVHLDLKEWIRKKALRILIPLIVWSAVCLCVHACLGQITWNEAFFSFLKIPFVPVEGVYWFMYTIFGLYLFAPFISKALENNDAIRFFLILWGISLCLPYVNAFIPGAWNLRGDYYHILGNFGGYLGYMILGFYLRKQHYSWKQLALVGLIGSVIILLTPLCFLNNSFPGVTHETLYGYLTINVASLCILYFLFMKKAISISCDHSVSRGGCATSCYPQSKLLRDLSAKSFGIYLVHILIMRQGIWPLWQAYLPDISYAVQIPITALLTFILSYLLIKTLSYLPYSKYLF